jgi:2-polyprenyl-3-methyl-5-hydroxy-6-metoxy-1,4-benzoquinol methylase
MEIVNNTTPCPICGQGSKHVFNAKNYNFSKCVGTNCGHIFVDPIPTLEELNQYYAKNTSGLENSDSWTMVEDYAVNPAVVHNFYLKNRIKFLRRKNLLRKDTSVLDVGCSTGMFLRVLKDLGYQDLLGVDVSLEQVDHCRHVNQIEAYQKMEQIPIDRKFDLVSLYAVLEHVPNPKEVLTQAIGLLRNSGKLIVDVPNYRSLYRVLTGKKWLWLIPPVHLQYFSPKSMEHLADSCGLQIEYASTKSTSTYTYILAHHVFDLLHREMPDTSLATSWRSSVIAFVEITLRVMLAPLSAIMRVTKTHNQIIYVFSRKGKADV